MKKHSLKRVEFSCEAPDAQSVHVAGGFNDWKPDATPLQRDQKGAWKTVLRLPSGRHEFKFVVDGHWSCRPGCHEDQHGCPDCVLNSFGTMNRVLKVP